MPSPSPSVALRTALVAGATGLVGTALVAQLAATREFSRVVALARREPSRPQAGIEWKIVDFATLDVLRAVGATDGFCALGTTRARAGSPEAFREVDLGHALAFARLSRREGARRFVLVSSVGADSGSANLYLRTKGELEDAVRHLGFESLTVMRPGLLLGERREFRAAEAAARALVPLVAPLLVARLRRYRPIEAARVAAAMVGAALEGVPGDRIATFDDIMALARSLGVGTNFKNG